MKNLKFIAMLLAVCMIAGMLPVSVFAAEGETVKYTVRSSEFKKTECKRCLSSLPEDYDEYFFARYSVDKDALEASLKTLRASNDQKLSRFIVKTLADAKKNARTTRELLSVD